MVAAVRIAVLALLVGVVVTGCGQFDENVTFTIKNDTAAPVVLKQCGSTCKQFHEVDHLKPGESVPEGAFVGGPSNDFFVLSPTANSDHCLSVLISSTPTADLVVPVSTAKPCSAAQQASPDLWGKLFD